MPKSPERCQEIRQEMRSKILHESMLYFAKNGFSGTKISDLSQYIGIAQGTIYVYFQSKEDLFQEIFSIVNNHQDINDMKCLTYLPISAKQKMKFSFYQLLWLQTTLKIKFHSPYISLK